MFFSSVLCSCGSSRQRDRNQTLPASSTRFTRLLFPRPGSAGRGLGGGGLSYFSSHSRRVKLATGMSVPTARRQLERRPQHLFKHLLFQLANRRVPLSQFVIRTVCFSQHGEFTVNIDFHPKSAPHETRLKLSKPLSQRSSAHRRSVSQDESLANPIGHPVANRCFFDAMQFVPQQQGEFRVVVAQPLLPSVRQAISMMRPASTRSNRLAFDQPQVLEPIQPLANRSRSDSRRFAQLLNSSSTGLVKLLEKLIIAVFYGHTHRSTDTFLATTSEPDSLNESAWDSNRPFLFNNSRCVNCRNFSASRMAQSPSRTMAESERTSAGTVSAWLFSQQREVGRTLKAAHVQQNAAVPE